MHILSLKLHNGTRNNNVRANAMIIIVSLISVLMVTIGPIASSGMLAHAQATFPPPIFYQLSKIPSYAVTIPSTTLGFSSYDPVETSIPLGMSVIWFNDGNGLHSVTTLSNKTYSPPQTIDSGPLLPNGGSFIHTFSKPGVYDYHDKFDPHMYGRINVGSEVVKGKNMYMYPGENPPLHKDARVVLRFVPKTVAVPPTLSLTYNVTLLNPTGKPLYSHLYSDDDGILDLELVPIHKATVNITKITNATTANTTGAAASSKNATATAISANDFTTWGPDFSSQEAYRTTGTLHIKGPVLVENSPYAIRVAIVRNDNSIPSPPIVDYFLLPVK